MDLKTQKEALELILETSKGLVAKQEQAAEVKQEEAMLKDLKKD